MQQHDKFIGGAWTKGSSYNPNLNPSNLGDTIAEYARGDALSAGIATTSLKHATHFKRHSQAGIVMVNLPTAGVDYHVPFGGHKVSTPATAAEQFLDVVQASPLGLPQASAWSKVASRRAQARSAWVAS